MPGGTHLELEERERLAALKAEGLSLRAIAARLGRAASTISRELRRNALPSPSLRSVGTRRNSCYVSVAYESMIVCPHLHLHAHMELLFCRCFRL